MFVSRGSILFLLLTISLLLPNFSRLLVAEEMTKSAFKWEFIEGELSLGSYEISPKNAVLASSVVLLKIPRNHFRFQLVRANDLSRTSASVGEMVKHVGGEAGINAHFFDPEGYPLGLLIRNYKKEQGVHKGGNVLTGIFYMLENSPRIGHRGDFKEDAKISLALQSGPRLIVDGKPSKVSSSNDSSRRSGIAITADGYVILYATKVRFPGATLSQIQEMLLEPELKITAALNLDGGGSSQLYIKKTGELDREVNISGGDNVPVALVVSKR